MLEVECAKLNIKYMRDLAEDYVSVLKLPTPERIVEEKTKFLKETKSPGLKAQVFLSKEGLNEVNEVVCFYLNASGDCRMGSCRWKYFSF